MKRDSARNAQIEILRDYFQFEEQRPALRGASAYIDPARADAAGGARALYASANTSPKRVRALSKGVTGTFSTPTPQRERRPLDDIAIGIATTGRGGSGKHRLVALYQDARLKKSDPTLSRLKDKFQDEIDIKYSGRVRSLAAWHRTANDPLRIGASVGHPLVTAGTLGCFVIETTTGDVGILSNNHVLARSNAAARGDAILQPGRSDGGQSPQDEIATLIDFVPIDLGNTPNFLDCAWARLHSGKKIEEHVVKCSADVEVSTVNSSKVVPLRILDRVAKIGRTTGYTQGEVTAEDVVNLRVGFGANQEARFDNQIQIESLNGNAFSDGGDSGSVILRNGAEPGGLLFAGSRNGGASNKGLTFANPLSAVLRELNLELLR